MSKVLWKSQKEQNLPAPRDHTHSVTLGMSDDRFDFWRKPNPFLYNQHSFDNTKTHEGVLPLGKGILFCFFRQSHYVSLVGFELSMYTTLASKSQQISLLLPPDCWD